MLHLTRVIQDISLHFYVYIFEKKCRRSESGLSDPSIQLVPPYLRTLGICLHGNIYQKSYPFEGSDIGVEKTKRLTQDRGLKECFDLENLLPIRSLDFKVVDATILLALREG